MSPFRLFYALLCVFLPIFLFGQDFAQQLYSNYNRYKETSIEKRRFKHQDLTRIIRQLSDPFKVTTLGKSLEDRDIYLIKAGNGPVSILLWSQMHGNEATATMALLDIFNFFSKKDELTPWKEQILQNVTLYFIPMLNPDGSDRFQRRTALNVDLNRDALRLQTPEGKLLYTLRNEIQADWGFNLHDQNRYTSVGVSGNTATISFLAPAYDYEKSINPVRKKAMQQIALMNETLQTFIPGLVAKYNDDFEPRAFGDNIQKWGTSTILIESGGYRGDPEKQYIRKINFTALISAFLQIANKSYTNLPLEKYEAIPFNKRYLHEFLIRNVNLQKKGATYRIDLAFRKNELQFNKATAFFNQSFLADLGDLSTFYAYQEFDATDYTLMPGKTYPKILKNLGKLKKLNFNELYNEGYTDVLLKKLSYTDRQEVLPIGFWAKKSNRNNNVSIGNNPSFFLVKENQKKFIVINGKIFPLETTK